MNKIWNKHTDSYKNHLKLERGLSDHSIRAYLSDIGKLRGSTDLPIEKVTSDTIKTLIHELNNRKLSANSQARIISGLKSFYNYLKDRGVVKENPISNIDLPKIEKKVTVILTTEEIELLMMEIDTSTLIGIRNRAMIELLASSGLRVSEVTNLKFSNILNDGNTIKIMGKRQIERVVPITQTSQKYIKSYTKFRNEFIFVDRKFEDFVFLSINFVKVTENAIRLIVKDIEHKSRIDKTISPHTFRHTYATQLMESGMNLRMIQQLLGHTAISSTERYVHLDYKALSETIKQFHPRG